MQVTDSTVQQVVAEVFSTMLGIEVVAANSCRAAGSGTWLAACIHLTGACTGSIIVEVPIDFGRRAAAAMFGSEPASLADGEVKDAMGEVANMVAGALRLALPTPNQISLPSVAEGRELSCSVPGSQLALEACFDVGETQFRVSLFDRLPK